MAEHQTRKRILVSLACGLAAFLVFYLAGALISASNRHAAALEFSKNHAHTVIGREGYEYIFEPNTQILLDKIMPRSRAITLHVVYQDYLPFTSGQQCLFADPDICAWMDILIFFDHDPSPLVLRIVVVALIAGLITSGSVYTFYKPRSAATIQA